MIALVEGAIRQRTPNEIALTLVLVGVHADLSHRRRPALAHGLECRAVHDGLSRPRRSSSRAWAPTCRRSWRCSCVSSHHHRRSARGHRHRRHGPGTAGQHHRQERQSRRESPATSIRCSWTRPARSRWATARRRGSFPSDGYTAARTRRDWPPWRRSADQTPEGQVHRPSVPATEARRRGQLSSRCLRTAEFVGVHRSDPNERHRPRRTAARSARAPPDAVLQYVQRARAGAVPSGHDAGRRRRLQGCHAAVGRDGTRSPAWSCWKIS